MHSMTAAQWKSAYANGTTDKEASVDQQELAAAKNMEQSLLQLVQEVNTVVGPKITEIANDIAKIMQWFGAGAPDQSPAPGQKIPDPLGFMAPDFSPSLSSARSGHAGAWVRDGKGDLQFIPLTDDEISAQEKQESGGRQIGANGQPITSKAGALGIMQLLPSTAQDVAKRHAIPFDLNKLKYDKSYNEQLGILYMADLIQQFGSYNAALVAYNAGPNSSSIKNYLAGHPEKMAGETQGYLAKLGVGSTKPASGGQGKTIKVGDIHIHDHTGNLTKTANKVSSAMSIAIMQANTGLS